MEVNPAQVAKFVPLLACALFLLFAMLAAWAGTIIRLALGYPLLPAAKRRRVPWGIGSIVIFIGAYLALSFAVSATMVGVMRAREAAPAVAGKQTGEKAQATGAKVKARRSFTPYEQLVIMSVLNVVFIPMIPMTLGLTSGARLKDLGLERRGIVSNVARGVVACLLIQPVAYAIMIPLSRYQNPQPHPIMQLLRESPSAFNVFLALAGAIVLAPAAEELFFRGVLMPYLSKLVPRRRTSVTSVTSGEAAYPDRPTADTGLDSFRADEVVEVSPGELLEVNPGEILTAPDEAAAAAELSTREAFGQAAGACPELSPSTAGPTRGADFLANALTSLVFAGLHFAQWPAPIPLFLLSLVLGFVYQRTGSLWASLAVHACFNAVSTIMLIVLVLSGVPLPDTGKTPPVGEPVSAAPVMRDVSPRNIRGFFRELHLSVAEPRGNILFPSRRESAHPAAAPII